MSGAKSALLPTHDTKPGIAVFPCFRVKFAAVSVAASIDLLNVAAIFWFKEISVAKLAGSVEFTKGGVITVDVPVVKLQETFCSSALPARFFAPVVIVAVYTVLDAKMDEGAKSAVVPT